MNGKNKYLKRFLALVLSVAMVVTYMPASLIAYAAEGDEQPAATETVDQQQTTEPQPGDNDKTEVKEEVEDNGTADDGAQTSQSGQQSKTESSAPSEQASDTMTGEDDGPEYPAVTLEGSAGDIDVIIEAPEGALPEGVKLDVEKVSSDDANAVVADYIAEDKAVDEILAVDISFNKDGKEVEPKESVTVKISSDKIKGDDLTIYNRNKDNKVQKLDGEMEENGGKFVLSDFARLVMVTTKAKDGEESASAAQKDEPAENEEDGLNKEKLTFRDSKNSVDVYVVAQPGTFPEGTTMTVTSVANADVQDAVDSAMGGETKNFKAVDITFYANGEKVEPKKEVSVRLTTKAFKSEESLAVVHVEDPDTNKAKVMDLTKATDTVAQFRTDGFSVYVVVETVVPRLEVKFMNGDTEIATMHVKGADTDAEIEKIVYDPGVGNIAPGIIFRGWTTNPDYVPYDDEGNIVRGMDISKVREDVRTRVDALTDADGEVTYYAMLFRTYNVSYYDVDNVSLGTDEVSIRSDSGTDKVNYTVNMAYASPDASHDFEGWVVMSGQDSITGYPDNAETTIIGDETVHYYRNETQIEISGDVTFGVNLPEGHWLVFHEGKGGTYKAPQFIKLYGTEEETKAADPGAMERQGYTFGGWFTEDKVDIAYQYDSDGKVIDYTVSLKDGVTEADKYVFGSGISDSTDLYAYWIPNTKATYTVLIWTQNIDRDGYDFVESVTVENATPGSTPAVSHTGTGRDAYAVVDGTAYNATTDPDHFKGFSYDHDDLGSKTVSVTGDTVVNVYYNRNQYTLTFNVPDHYEYTETTGNNGTQYGIVNGEYVRVYRHGN